MQEIWKDIKDTKGRYQVSNLGRVKRKSFTKEDRILKPELRTGYPSIQICLNGKRKHARIHRLVATAFIPNPDNLPQVNHKDRDRTNNRVDNLEWCEEKYNLSHARMLKPVYCYDLDKVFESASVAEKETGVNRTSIVKCCKNIQNSAGGMWWSYEENKNEKFPPR